MRILLFFALFVSQASFAAQGGSVIVKEAKIHEFPKSDSKVLEKLPENSKVVVSNQPTEGFFKVRTSLGQMGWISGQEILVSGGNAPTATGTPTPPIRRKKVEPLEEEFGGEARASRMRFLVGYGLSNLTYGGLKDNFSGVSQLNYGTSWQFEMQKRIGALLFWALRVETYSTKTGNVTLTNGNIQTIKTSSVPIQLGLVFSPINGKKIRFGIATYGGVALLSATTVNVATTTTNAEVKYGSTDPVYTLSGQLTYMMSNNLGIFFDGSYRTQQTALFPESTVLSVQGFKINYTGYVGHVGLELRL